MTRTAKYASLALLTLSLVGCSEAAPPDPGEPVTISRSPLDGHVCEILVDGDDIFYRRDEAEIIRLDKRTLLPTVLFSKLGSYPGWLALDGEYLYFAKAGHLETYEGQIIRVPRRGGELTVLAENEDIPMETTIAQGRIYYSARSQDGAIKWIPLSGGTPTIIAPTTYFGGDMAADKKTLYLGFSGTISKMSFDGVEEVLSTNTQSFMREMIIDETHIYWAAENHYVRKVPKEGGVGIDLAVEPGIVGNYTDLAQDETHLYWTTGGYDAHPGRILRVSKDGGPMDTLYRLPGGDVPCGIAVDQQYIYWGNWGYDGIFRMAKPQ